MTGIYDRHLKFGSVVNFRDIGGYKGKGNRRIAWRRIFRSGEFRNVTKADMERLTGELGVVSVLDLRSGQELKNNGKGLLSDYDVRYCNIAFMTDDDGGDPEANARRYAHCTNMGEFYIEFMRQPDFGRKVVQALEMIGDPANHPLVFHCAVGKDRTGMLAAMLLTLLGVSEADIIEDYTLSEPYMDELRAKLKANPSKDGPPLDIPDYFWKAPAPSMRLLLDFLKADYGSVEKYLLAVGMSPGLPEKLKSLLLA